jgi:hypothetical protein
MVEGAGRTGDNVSFQARYPGRCTADDCDYGDHQIREGDEITYVEDEIMHESCASRARRREPPLCVNCFQYHRGECL